MLQKTQKVAGGASHRCKLDAGALCGLSNYVSQGLVRESGPQQLMGNKGFIVRIKLNNNGRSWGKKILDKSRLRESEKHQPTRTQGELVYSKLCVCIRLRVWSRVGQLSQREGTNLAAKMENLRET